MLMEILLRSSEKYRKLKEIERQKFAPYVQEASLNGKYSRFSFFFCAPSTGIINMVQDEKGSFSAGMMKFEDLSAELVERDDDEKHFLFGQNDWKRIFDANNCFK